MQASNNPGSLKAESTIAPMTKPEFPWVVGARLAGISALALLTLITVDHFTRPVVDASQQAQFRRTLTTVLPEHDNDPTLDYIDINAPNLSKTGDVRIFRAKNNDQLIAVALSVTSTQGYSGPIQILAGINIDGTLFKAEVISHRETPGLGDAIESRKSHWLQQFIGYSVIQVDDSGWHTSQRGGKFDGISGATVSAEAVTRSLYEALSWVENNHEQLGNTEL